MAIFSKKNIEGPPNASLRDDLLSEQMFRESLEELRANAEAIKTALEKEKIECDADPACREAELMVKLHVAYHDNFGAFKTKRLVQETVELFAPERGAPAVAVREMEGEWEYTLPQEMAGRRLLLVGVAELDRLNKGGSTAPGDAGLRAAVSAIDEASLKYLGPERARAKSVFRWGGNEFCVVFDDITEEELAVIEGAIVNAPLDMGTWKGIEPPPLSTHKMDFQEVVNVLNDVESSKDESDRLDPRDAGYQAFGILRRIGDYNLEVKKFVNRVDRAVEKLQAVRAKRLTWDEANGFFENYLKKSFYGTGLDSLEAVERLYLKSEPDDFRRAVEEKANTAARGRFADDRQFAMLEDHIVDVRFRELNKAAASVPRAARAAEEFDARQKIATIASATEGQIILSGKAAKMAAAKNTRWARAERLEYLLEAAKRDEGTGLLERGQFYEDLNAQVAEAEAVGEGAAVIFIDMGFLKYFNDAGGRKVGDAALRQAAVIMENAIMEADVEATAYRYGGDEFAIRVAGGRAAANLVKKAIQRLRDETGRIPDLAGLRAQRGGAAITGESRADYAPTELVFNFGIAELSDFYATLNELEASGELAKIMASRGLDKNELLAELAVKLADTSVNYEKAVSRFRLLMALMEKPAYRDVASAYHARVESIIKYSQKAIIGNMGGDAALRIFAENRAHEDPDVLNAQLERFVSDRVEKLKKIKESEKDLVDKLVELHAAKSRLNERVKELTVQLGAEHRRVIELEAKRQEAEKAYEGIVKARQKIAA